MLIRSTLVEDLDFLGSGSRQGKKQISSWLGFGAGFIGFPELWGRQGEITNPDWPGFGLDFLAFLGSVGGQGRIQNPA